MVMSGTLPPPIRNVRIVTPLVAHPGHMFGQDREEAEEHAPRLPEADEAGDRGLARGERIAFDLHVEEVLHGDAQDRRPEETGADGRRHEGPDDVLTRSDAEAGKDDARSEHLAEGQRFGHVAVRHRRQVAVADGVKKLSGVGSGVTCLLSTHGGILVHLLLFVPAGSLPARANDLAGRTGNRRRGETARTPTH